MHSLVSPSTLDRLVDIALAAGAAAMQFYRQSDGVELKRDGTPVTRADRAAHDIIVPALKRLADDIPVISEEADAPSYEERRAWRRFWLVDPLDGTKEFISANGEFTVNIALVVEGSPAIGVVYAPSSRRLFSGRPGRAEAILVDEGHSIASRRPIEVRKPADPLVIVASRSHRTPETDRFIAGFPAAETVSIGSSLKFCLIAAGQADLYPRFGRTMEWDTAAGDAVLRAAGGTTMMLDGRPLIYGKRNQPDEADFANPHFIASGGAAPADLGLVSA